MKIDLDKIPKKHLETVSDLLNKYKDDIQSREYTDMYADLYDQVDHEFIGEITSILYASYIDPLKYMTEVPQWFLAYSPCVDGDFIIPGNITSIDACAFYNCTSLTSITIPDSVTSIGEDAFNYCYGLNSIIFTGTKEQWKYIRKGLRWDNATDDYTIHCKDGDVEKRL